MVAYGLLLSLWVELAGPHIAKQDFNHLNCLFLKLWVDLLTLASASLKT